MQKYYIKLTETEHAEVKKWLQRKGLGIQAQKRGRILLDLHEVNGQRRYTTKQISHRQGVCKRVKGQNASSFKRSALK